jgi:hypothetical protein
VISFTYQPHYSGGKSSKPLCAGGKMGLEKTFSMFYGEKRFLHLSAIEPRFFSHPARSLVAVASYNFRRRRGWCCKPRLFSWERIQFSVMKWQYFSLLLFIDRGNSLRVLRGASDRLFLSSKTSRQSGVHVVSY